MSFVTDLKCWQEAEKRFAKYLLFKYDVVVLEFSQWKFKDYDIKLTTKEWETTYEVKCDRQADKTWNVFFEIRYNWNASWLFTSKADYFVQFANGKCYIQEMGELILRLMNVNKKEMKGWDWWKTLWWLVSMNDIESLFDVIDLDEEI